MGLLQNGQWVDQWYDTKNNQGEFKRQESRFRHWITPDGSAGPTGNGGFKAEPGRYHLYVSLACPWAHRTLIFRKLKGLESLISVSVVDPLMLEHGWSFSGGDDLYGLHHLYQVYLKAAPDYEGRVTVPVLWDKKTQTIVNNESAEIIRMFNSAFDHLTDNTDNYAPEVLLADIDAINERVYHNINNGVYRAGFATTQEAYETAYRELFETLDCLEAQLQQQRYLVGDCITEADWRLFTTLIRFDAVYHGHFKCNRQRLEDYPAISAYVRELYQVPGVADTVDFGHIKEHYYGSHKTINPTGVVPVGPDIDYTVAHARQSLSESREVA
ncbi:glutathione S-transferase family protein [Pseudomaricurvus alkylphenolicus]|jgi:putative glutathione S-transferase|uniref:glutathione S-transferase family protein n=1 Tax=Pseudomaricurvus alkylphenolicus TaxID=1306991 RepID=UPI00141FF04D|nr:glutathione S-transferase family protein [Pseudomaricurvus alkylphenolicus]NIB40190.1 glutathione S-transferase family protein [Pseudomaricurvus alkylphenolicus]